MIRWDDEESWRPLAACSGAGVEPFFTVEGTGKREEGLPGAALCGCCEVRAECLNYALFTAQPEGVWGGLTTRERRRMIVEIRKAT